MQKVCVYSAKPNRRKTHTITASQNKTWTNNQLNQYNEGYIHVHTRQDYATTSVKPM